MSQLYRCDQLAGFGSRFLNGLGGYVCVSANPAVAPLVLHAPDGLPSPDGSAPIWDFATQGTWGDFANANAATALAVRPHIFAGEDAMAADVTGPNDPRFFPNPQDVGVPPL